MVFCIYIVVCVHFIQKIQAGCYYLYFMQVETEAWGTKYGTVLRQTFNYS